MGSVKTTEGFGNVAWGNNDTGASGFGSFENTSETFDFGKLNAQSQVSDEKVKEKPAGDEPEDNGNYTLSAIVDLEEVDVATGHENEKELESFFMQKLYRWGKDVAGHPTWKNRATKTKLEFYQNAKSGKIRIVTREQITNKLRLNQLVASKAVLNIDRKSEKQISWSAFDVSIEAEDDDGKKGFCMFAAKFADKETADAFEVFINSATENNENL